MFENEEWRLIAELDHYSVSTHGRVKKNDSETARKVYTNDKGFVCVLLYGKDSRSRYLRHVNKLVATAFLPPPLFSDMTAVWHIDGDLLNCHVSNLKWDTIGRVREWNEMQRRGEPQFKTPPVRNNRTGAEYESAYHCALAESMTEAEIITRIERQARHTHDDTARYRYI